MRKIKLDLEALSVESFATGEEKPAAGTVQAHVGTALCNTANQTCEDATCGGEQTCGAEYSCADSCGACNTYNCGTPPDSNILACGWSNGWCQSGIDC